MSDLTPPSAPGGIRGWLRTTWGKVIAVAGALATVIGAVGIVVTVTEALGRDDTTVESIAIESEQVDAPAPRTGLAEVAGVDLGRYEGERIDWAIPVDAPWEGFFAATGEMTDTGCTVDQLAWLKANGVPYEAKYLRVTFTNTATSGSNLRVSDIRPEGELTEPPIDVVEVDCQPGIGGESLAQRATLAIGSGEIAVFGDIDEYCVEDPYSCWYAGTGELGEPGTPVIFDIAPGGVGELVLSYEHALDFRGRFLATVTVDGASSDLVLTPGGEDIYAPVITIATASLSHSRFEGFTCWLDDGAGPCDQAAWRAELAARATR